MDESERRAGRDPGDETRRDAPLVAGPGPEPGPGDHHPLEADVDDAGPLGPHGAETGEEDRRGKAERRRDATAREEVGRIEGHAEQRQDGKAEDDPGDRACEPRRPGCESEHRSSRHAGAPSTACATYRRSRRRRARRTSSYATTIDRTITAWRIVTTSLLIP